jgi:macrolide-specific efflux system membrane fusion protein
VSYVYVGSGQTVNKGERLFQLKYPLEEKSADADKDDEDGPKTGETAYGYADIVAPKNGITGTYRVSQGGNVDKGTVVTQVRSTQYRVQASVDPVQLYVLDPLPKQAEVTIPRGPEPFECKYLRLTEAEAAASNVKNGGGQTGSDSDADGDDSGDEQNQATLTCTVPKNVRVFHGLQADVKVSTGKAKNVLLVPVTAVQGLGDNGTVWVPDKSGDGKEKAVTLGRSDGTNIEVKKGLKEGDSILEYVPGTEPEDDSGGFSEMDGMSSSGEM